MSPVAAFLVALGASWLSVALVAVVSLSTAPAEVHAAVFPFSGDRALLAVAAHARVVDTWLGGAIVAAVPETDNFSSAMSDAGAVLTLPLPRIAGCAPSIPNKNK